MSLKKVQIYGIWGVVKTGLSMFKYQNVLASFSSHFFYVSVDIDNYTSKLCLTYILTFIKTMLTYISIISKVRGIRGGAFSISHLNYICINVVLKTYISNCTKSTIHRSQIYRLALKTKLGHLKREKSIPHL